MAETSTEKKISLKITVDINAKKVVFAEANAEFVDFIFSLISLPLSSVTKVLLKNEKGMVGSLGALYKSIESLDTQCCSPNITRASVLEPKKSSVTIPMLLLHDTSVSLFGKKASYTYKELKDNTPKYVNGGTVYLVRDNLEVKKMSIVLSKSYVKEVGALEDRHVEVGLQEGLAILKASLGTEAVLTTVFLKKNLNSSHSAKPSSSSEIIPRTILIS